MKKFTIKTDNGFIKTTIYKKVPKGVKPFDILRFELKQDGVKEIDHFITPDEALLFATALMRGWLNSTAEINKEIKENKSKEVLGE